MSKIKKKKVLPNRDQKSNDNVNNDAKAVHFEIVDGYLALQIDGVPSMKDYMEIARNSVILAAARGDDLGPGEVPFLANQLFRNLANESDEKEIVVTVKKDFLAVDDSDNVDKEDYLEAIGALIGLYNCYHKFMQT